MRTRPCEAVDVSRARQHVERETERAREAYGSAIGLRIGELLTPCLLLDPSIATANIVTMADAMRALPSTIRPHFKAHKSTELARRQVEAGARGLSAATVWEAAVLAGAGFDDIFVVNTLAEPGKIGGVARLARERRMLLAVDDLPYTEALSAAAVREGAVVGAVIEVNTGMDRAGVDSAAAAVRLARRITRLPGLRLEGITGYEGHCALEPDPDRRRAAQERAMDLFLDVARSIEDAGIECALRSAGGTSTWRLTAGRAGITEIQAGSYVLMDRFHGRMAPEFTPALSVLSTVVSASGGRIVLDAGSKSVDMDEERVLGEQGLPIMRIDEEHAIASAPEAAGVRLGDKVRIVPGYSPSTLNVHDVYHVVENGAVVDIWPVLPRGPGHGGMATAKAVGP